jgi:uncharacterized membrane protein YedE/YeeE
MDGSSIAIALLGGALLGLGGALLLLSNGRLAGISGIVGGLFQPARGEWGWRAMFVLGLVGGGAVFAALQPAAFMPARGPLPLLVVAGIVVGFGSRLGGGCTSGHGVCGLSRLSKRSIVGTVTFMLTGIATVALVYLAGGDR